MSRSLLKKDEAHDFNDRLTYKMHDLIHDIAQSIVGSEVLVLRNDVSNISREARHISLLFEEVTLMMKAIMEKKALVGKPIRSFLNLYPDVLKDSTILNSFIPSVMSLRVLSLDDLNIKKVPKSLGKLIHLRYLDLSNNDFEILPNSITRLKNLQTLKLRSCWNLKKFPKNMRQLINLRHLENDECRSLTHMPHGMGKLTSLQSLPLFIVGNDIGRLRNHKLGSLSELESLHQLRGSLCIKDLQNAGYVETESRPKILEKQKYLESLKLGWGQRSDQNKGGEGDKWVMEGLQPNPQLKELFIKCYGAKEFPSWMMNDHELASQLPNLIKIEIRYCSNLESLELPSSSSLSKLEIYDCSNLASLELPSSYGLFELRIIDCPILGSVNVASLTSLEELTLRGVRAEVLRDLIFVSSSSSLKSLLICEIDGKIADLEVPLLYVSTLETLYIWKCYGLTTLLHLMDNLSSLTYLLIYDCPKLTSLPQQICSLQKLQTLYVCDYPHLKERYNKEIGEDRAKIAHIPYVYFHLDGFAQWEVRNS